MKWLTLGLVTYTLIAFVVLFRAIHRARREKP